MPLKGDPAKIDWINNNQAAKPHWALEAKAPLTWAIDYDGAGFI
jgi:hypothetical protein